MVHTIPTSSHLNMIVKLQTNKDAYIKSIELIYM